MTEGERIHLIRQAEGINLTLEQFGKRVGVSAVSIHKVENSQNNVSDRLRRDICREFHVNETWLRTGEGEMFLPQTRNDQISDFLGDLLHDQPDFRHRLVCALASMTVDEWAMLERKIREITEEEKEPPPDGDGT